MKVNNSLQMLKQELIKNDGKQAVIKNCELGAGA